ncbi:MAG: hypothetical protein CMK09_12595 [Ponticaulis sp.]|nr:hypothetical protein [Ponticaulis sp.]|tara:strand:- start:2651 stop:3649 length:999 start_codon:yes stop_codon:yes gene_type:complete
MPTSDKSSGSITDRLHKLPDEFRHFEQIYEREIRPVLVEKEIDRKAAMNKAKSVGLIGVVAGVLVAVGGFLLMKTFFAIVIGLVVGGGAIIYGMSGVSYVMKHAKELMVTPVAEKFGLTYNEAASPLAEGHLKDCHTHKVVPGWDRRTLQDEMIGERNGRRFEFFEAHLEDKRTTRDSNGRTSTTWVTVFRGQCWVIDAPKEFHGTTRISRDSGLFNALGGLGSKYSRAKLESPDFEKAFEVYTTDQVESRYLLTPEVMQSFLDIERTFKGNKFRATFHGNRVYAALENGNMFEPGSMFSSLDDPNRVADILEDIATVFHLVDVLGKTQPSP